jgi:hypothetical protein
MWALIQEKAQISENIPEPSAMSSNAWNSPNFSAILSVSAGNPASTNILMPFQPAVISVTNSN